MEKGILKQYQDLKAEIKENQARLERLQARLDRINDEGFVVDTVKGGEGGIQHFKIEGFPTAEHSRVKTMLIMRQSMLNTQINKAIDLVTEVEMFIRDVEDPYLRRIMRFRYIDDLSWVEVSHRMGGGNSPEAMIMAINRFFEKK